MSDKSETTPAKDTTPEVPSKAPELPTRPKSPFTTQLAELQSAFPDSDKNVCRAVLVAAGGNLENAFNGLLALTDDTIRPAPPPQAERDQQLQLERDAQLARELAGAERAPRRRDSEQRYERPDRPRGRGPPREDERSEFEEFSENLSRFTGEASRSVGNFFNTIKSRFQNEWQDEEPDEDYYGRVDPLNRGSTRADAYRQVRAARDSDSQHYIHMESADTSPPPKPSRPAEQRVNAFGEDKPTRWEPIRSTAESDAFFIGESDEEVDSLDENTPLSVSSSSKAAPTTAASTASAKPSAKDAAAKLKAAKEEAMGASSSRTEKNLKNTSEPEGKGQTTETSEKDTAGESSEVKESSSSKKDELKNSKTKKAEDDESEKKKDSGSKESEVSAKDSKSE